MSESETDVFKSAEGSITNTDQEQQRENGFWTWTRKAAPIAAFSNMLTKTGILKNEEKKEERSRKISNTEVSFLDSEEKHTPEDRQNLGNKQLIISSSFNTNGIKERKYGFHMRESMVLSSVVREPADNSEPIHPAVEQWFYPVNTATEGSISSKELQEAFEVFQGRRFSDSVCKFIVRIFDLDKNGGININEFETLYYYVKQWIKGFNKYDPDGTGFINENDFNCALQELDIHFSPDFVRFLMTRNNPTAKTMSLDQYIITCIQLQKFTDEFKSRDPGYTGNINMKYEDFLEMILRCL